MPHISAKLSLNYIKCVGETVVANISANNEPFLVELWIRIRIWVRIGFGFDDFVNSDCESGSGIRIQGPTNEGKKFPLNKFISII
jgi:hypothetical protein